MRSDAKGGRGDCEDSRNYALWEKSAKAGIHHHVSGLAITRNMPGGSRCVMSRHVTNYPLSGYINPYGITAGPDGNMWFTEDGNPSAIGKITLGDDHQLQRPEPTGIRPARHHARPGWEPVVHRYRHRRLHRPDHPLRNPHRNHARRLRARDHDGPGRERVVHHHQRPQRVGRRISPSRTFTTFTGTGIDDPYWIAAGPDGNVWFTNYGNNTIGRITPSGVVTDFTAPGISEPLDITAGPGRTLWFANYGNNTIGRMTTKGNIADQRRAGHQPTRPGSPKAPMGHCGSPTPGTTTIGRITNREEGVQRHGPGISDPAGIAPGPDGSLWFANQGSASLGRITTSRSPRSLTPEPAVAHRVP